MKFDQNILDKVKFKGVEECPLCHTNEGELFAEEKIGNKVIRATKCTSCGLIYMATVVVSDDLGLLYESYSGKRNEQDVELGKKRLKMYELDYKYVEPYILKDDKNILDIGSGDGDFLALFPKHFNKYAVEVDVNARNNGKNNHPEIKFHSSLEDIAEGEVFDIIIFRGTLQYIIDLDYLYNFYTKHLRGDGRIFLLAIPNADSLLAIIQKEHWSLWNAIEHRYCFGITQIKKLFNGSTFVDSIFPYMGTPYENYSEDVKKVIEMFNNPESRKQKVPFFGSIMNIILKK